MQRSLYADNYPERRREALFRAENRCEQLVEGQRCPHRLGRFRVSRAGNCCFEQLSIHHPNHDPWNPEAELLVVCSSCHMKLHRQAQGQGKAAPRKQGYRVISLDHLATRVQGAGLLLQPTEACRIHWQAGPFAAEAADVVGAIVMAFHLLSREVLELGKEVQEARAALSMALASALQREEAARS